MMAILKTILVETVNLKRGGEVKGSLSVVGPYESLRDLFIVSVNWSE